MNLIGQGLERISERWAAFQSYFDYILDGGDSLMQPNEHDNLLFDDGAFSRSRRYFWAIDCLSEFESCISDNIAQWEMYKQARVTPLFSSNILPDLDLTQFRNAERQYHILQNQREYFRRKLASTKALRDAVCFVFHAPASSPGFLTLLSCFLQGHVTRWADVGFLFAAIQRKRGN